LTDLQYEYEKAAWPVLNNLLGNRQNVGDINAWYAAHHPWCPNCHADFRQFHPAQDLGYHHNGYCRTDPRWQETGIERHWRELEQAMK
jgi:hypothetical protein